MAGIGTKLTLLKQRIIGGGEEEPVELKNLKEKIFSYPPDMRKVKAGIQQWLDALKSLNQHANHMAKSVVQSDVELESLPHMVMREISGDINLNCISVCHSLIDVINKKLKLVAELQDKCDHLNDLRLTKNRLRRKIEEAQKKGEKGATEISTFQEELNQAVDKHKELYNEIMGKFESIQEASDSRGGIGFLSEELDAFKFSQYKFFGACAAIYENHKDVKEKNPLNCWKIFESDMELAVRERSKHLSKQYISQTDGADTNLPGHAAEQSTKSSNDDEGSKNDGHTTKHPSAEEQTKADTITVKATYDYDPQNEWDILLKAGDIVCVQEQSEDGWWKGRNKTTGEVGYFPGNYCEIVDEEENV